MSVARPDGRHRGASGEIAPQHSCVSIVSYPGVFCPLLVHPRASLIFLVDGNTQIRGSIVVSISACHAEDPGSIPGRGDAVK